MRLQDRDGAPEWDPWGGPVAFLDFEEWEAWETSPEGRVFAAVQGALSQHLWRPGITEVEHDGSFVSVHPDTFHVTSGKPGEKAGTARHHFLADVAYFGPLRKPSSADVPVDRNTPGTVYVPIVYFIGQARLSGSILLDREYKAVRDADGMARIGPPTILDPKRWLGEAYRE